MRTDPTKDPLFPEQAAGVGHHGQGDRNSVTVLWHLWRAHALLYRMPFVEDRAPWQPPRCERGAAWRPVPQSRSEINPPTAR